MNLTQEQVGTIIDYTRRIGLGLGVRGLMNVQYVLWADPERPGPGVYVIEVNPRASRTVPFLSKVTGVPMVRAAVNVMLGRSLAEQGLPDGLWPSQPLVAVKAPVFSMSKLIGVDSYLGPEMKSTGEAMGIDRTFEAALAKALMASDLVLPPGGAMLLSISDRYKSEAIPLVHRLVEAGYRLYATEGTKAMIEALGLPVEQATKRLDQGYPNVIDVIREGTVNGVINTAETASTGTLRDGFHIRRAATEKRIPCFTSLDTARAAIDTLIDGARPFEVLPLPEYRDGAGPIVTAPLPVVSRLRLEEATVVETAEVAENVWLAWLGGVETHRAARPGQFFMFLPAGPRPAIRSSPAP